MSTDFTIIGDPHVKNSNLDLALGLFLLVEKMGNPTIWLGDMLDTKEVIRGKCLNMYLNYFSSSKLHHYVLVGNHDWFNLDCTSHSLESFKLLKNVTLVEAPTQIEGLPFYMVPYIHDQTILKDALEKAPSESVVIAHLEVGGCDYGNGHICKEGLKKSDFTKFKRVISGHFHKYQEVGNLTYLGTPFSHSFGEANQEKYIGVYTLEEDSLQLIPTPFRKHKSIEVNCSIPETLTLGDPKDLYRVILKGTQDEINKFDREPFKDLAIKWITRPEDYSLNEVKVDEAKSNSAQFIDWALTIRGLDEATTNLGLKFLEVHDD